MDKLNDNVCEARRLTDSEVQAVYPANNLLRHAAAIGTNYRFAVGKGLLDYDGRVFLPCGRHTNSIHLLHEPVHIFVVVGPVLDHALTCLGQGFDDRRLKRYGLVRVVTMNSDGSTAHIHLVEVLGSVDEDRHAFKRRHLAEEAEP